MLKELIAVSKFLEKNDLKKESDQIGELYFKAAARIERPHGDPYEYKLEGDKVYTRKRDTGSWNHVTNPDAKKKIEEKIFGKSQKTPEPADTSGQQSASQSKSWYESIPGYDYVSTGLQTAKKVVEDKYTEYTGGEGAGEQKASPADPGEIPFNTKEEGNKFRAWVNDNHSDWASANSLDRSGSHNNSYIKKAWKKFGTEYSEAMKPGMLQTGLEMVNEAVLQPALQLVNRNAYAKNLPLHVRGFLSYLSGRTSPWTEKDFNAQELKALKNMLAYRLTDKGNKAAYSDGGGGMGGGAMLNYGLADGILKERGKERTAITKSDENIQGGEKNRESGIYSIELEDQIGKFLGAVSFRKKLSQIKDEIAKTGKSSIPVIDFYDFNDKASKVGGKDAFMEDVKSAWSKLQDGKTYNAIRQLAAWRHSTGYRGYPVRIAVNVTKEDVGQDYSAITYNRDAGNSGDRVA